MPEQEVNIYSIAYRDCKEVSDSIDVNEEVGKASTILFYMDEILEALKIASELQAIGTVEELKALKENERQCEDCAGCTNYLCDCWNERARAINEFVERISEHDFEEKTEEYSNSVSFMREIKKIAEELKGGVV